MKLSFVIPAYNEEKGLGPVLEHLKKTMDASGFEYEIIVVNDGSTDRTGSVAGQYDFVTLKSHKRNLGYGASLAMVLLGLTLAISYFMFRLRRAR